MAICKKNVLKKIVALLLIVSVVTPCYANAAVIQPAQPMASAYLCSYNSYVCAMGDGKLEIWFSVTGDHYMDEIGTLSIQLYESTDSENWTWVDTFLYEDYPSMLAYNKVVHCSYVSYQGVAGRYYKAYVGIWAGKDGGGDTRYMWTTVEQAT